MGTDRAKAIYKDRAATAECVNAQARNRGLGLGLESGAPIPICRGESGPPGMYPGARPTQQHRRTS
jgi:hypothetical protein